MPTLRQEALTAFQELGFVPSRARGQNFLIHEQVIDKILSLVKVRSTDEILEVGPGLGFVTRALAAAGASVWAIEVDARLIEWLRSRPMGSNPRLHLVHADVLETDFTAFLPPRRVKVVASLPYSIATAVLARLFACSNRFSELTVMVQKEVAQRLAAVPGTKLYGPLALLLAIHGRITGKFQVSAEAFLPRPRVQSTVLQIRISDTPVVPVSEIPFLSHVVRTAFGQRRKTLCNSLASLVTAGRVEAEGILRDLGIDGRRRAETLTVTDFAMIARAIRQRQH